MVFGDDNWGSVSRQGKSWRHKPTKPPKKGKLCIAIAPFAAWPALLALANAIGQSLMG